VSDVEDLLRARAPQVLGVLARRFGDFDAAEDAVQEALLTAAVRWPADGVPDNPGAWLVQTATRKLIDQARSENARRRREEVVAVREPLAVVSIDATVDRERDDTLTVAFMCCHPVLTEASAVALTLRAVGGLTTAEIARGFVVPEATMAQRISRAKQRIKASGAPFRMPEPAEWTSRLRAMLRVLYLIFNEGYASTGGEALQRADLSGEAIRLTRALHRAVPAERPDASEVAGLLALMLLTDARRPARTDAHGDLVPLHEQDRRGWDRRQIAEGTALIDAAVVRGTPGEYQVQAAIAALHARAGTVEATDWAQIVALYGMLETMTGNPVVTLNRAVAAAMVHGPAHGLDLLAGLDEKLPGHYRLDAVRAHLHELAGDPVTAARHYRAAAARTTSVPERTYLTTRAARLQS